MDYSGQLSTLPENTVWEGGLIQNSFMIRGIKLLEGDSTEYSCRHINKRLTKECRDSHQIYDIIEIHWEV